MKRASSVWCYIRIISYNNKTCHQKNILKRPTKLHINWLKLHQRAGGWILDNVCVLCIKTFIQETNSVQGRRFQRDVSQSVWRSVKSQSDCKHLILIVLKSQSNHQVREHLCELCLIFTFCDVQNAAR